MSFASIQNCIQTSNAYMVVNKFVQRPYVKAMSKSFAISSVTSFCMHTNLKHAGTIGCIAALATGLFIAINKQLTDAKYTLDTNKKIALKGACSLSALFLAKAVVGFNFNNKFALARNFIFPLLVENFDGSKETVSPYL